MSIQVECPHCEKNYVLADKYGGRTIRCPECSEKFKVPDDVVEEIPVARAKHKPNKRRPARSSAEAPPPRRRRREAPDAPPKRKRTSAKKKQASGNSAARLALVGGGAVLVTLVGFGIYILNIEGDSVAQERKKSSTTISPGLLLKQEREEQVATALRDTDRFAALERERKAENEKLRRAEEKMRAAERERERRLNSLARSDSSKQNGGMGPSASGDSEFAAFAGMPDRARTNSSTNSTSSGSNSNQGNTNTGSVADSTNSGSASENSEPDLSLPDLIAKVDPSVVRIDVRTSEGLGNGSGFIVDDQGTIVTNYHVVAGAQNATVMLANKQKLRVLGFTHGDPYRDIAIIKVELNGRKLPFLKLTEKEIRKGEGVAAIGAPLGLDSTASEGIISGLRTAAELEDAIGLMGHKGTWVQTTTPISPGNSGGPLVNRKGRVVAINTMIMTVGQNLNFGIAAPEIRNALRLQNGIRALSPAALPEMDNGDGRPREVDIVGTPEAEKFLGRVKNMRVVIAAFAADPHGVVIGKVRSDALRAIEGAGINPGGRNATAFMLIAMTLETAGNAHELRIKSTMHFVDETSAAPKIYKIWESQGRVGTLSYQSLVNGVVPRTLSGKIKGYFNKLRSDVRRARAKAGPTL